MLLVSMHHLSLTIRKLVDINLMHLNSQHMSSAAIYLPILFQYYLYFRYGTSTHDTFKKMGIPYRKPWPFIGTLHTTFLEVGSRYIYIFSMLRLQKRLYLYKNTFVAMFNGIIVAAQDIDILSFVD